MKLEYYYEIHPLLQDINESGDLVFAQETEEYYYFGLIDALGHGLEANKAAVIALEYLKKNKFNDPAMCLTMLHTELLRSRGAVIALFSIEKESGEAVYSGIGNVVSKLLNTHDVKFVPRDGIVGFSIPSPTKQKYTVNYGDVIVMYSDGLKENFDILDMPGILNENAEEITKTLIKNYSKKDDDVSLLTIKAIL